MEEPMYKHTPPWYASLIGDVVLDHEHHRWTAGEIGDIDFERECPEARKTTTGVLVVERPEVVCLCGSTRFRPAFEDASRRLGLAGKIVLSVSCFGHDGDLTDEQMTGEAKVRLDELHKRKIDLADRVLVLNVGGYIGDSTRSEIAYATLHGVPVDYLESPDD